MKRNCNTCIYHVYNATGIVDNKADCMHYDWENCYTKKIRLNWSPRPDDKLSSDLRALVREWNK
jgi:hypothetical protein